MRRILFLSSLLFLLSSCPTGGSAFGIDAEGLEELLRAGNLSFMEGLGPERAAEALALGPGWAWVLGRYALRAGKTGLALAFWRAEAAYSKGPAAGEADADLRALLREEEDWEGLALAARARLAEEGGDASALVDALESFLVLGRNADEALELTDRLEGLGGFLGQRASALRLIALHRSGSPSVIQDLGAFLRSVTDPEAIRLLRAEFLDPLLASRALGEAGVALARALDLELPQADEAANEGASPSPGGQGAGTMEPASLALLMARALSAERDYGSARLAWKAAGFPSGIGALSEAVILEAGKAWLWGSGAAEGAILFAGLAENARSDPALRAAALLYAGRCLQAVGKDARARDAWRSAERESAPGSVRDAAAWYLLDSLASSSPAAALEAFHALAPRWQDPAYFSDVLGSFISALARSRDGESLLSLRRAVRGRAEPEILDRLAWLIRSLDADGDEGTSPEPATLARPGWASPLSYFSLMDKASIEALAKAFPEPGKAPAMGEDPDAETLEGFLSLLIRCGLSGEALGIAQRASSAAALDASAYRRLAARASSRGAHAQAALLAARATGLDGRVTRSDAELFYPRAYADELGTAARERGIPEEILFAQARTESWFNPGARSSAGALGLCQLMPETADGVARKLRMEEYDLRDPATSARLGATYLASQIDYFDGDLLLAILAYNGGMGRIRSLRRESPGLPTVLFMESLPIAETRDYGRKVLAAAAAYALIWGDPEAPARLGAALDGVFPAPGEG